ncbi:helix-turn-helix domain-containing protein [Companilactobacillus mishanensis]|uniref:Helix-turn-helix domain-containing protein n=1 Tax=Companilactobacillus mishanensis TaxID=2486008 RepID=A0A5P0ZJW5_9LACO|nr:helix-turn-helix transcriptional regulator [Companilactobacillus mishanensis]MQS53348.1 helix-turn-helix domain-containing protein [Companilactobacillus mishanensis]
MKFGNRLQQLRHAKKITQLELSQDMKVSRQTISSWETGNSFPDIDSLISISDYFDVSLDILIKDDPDVSKYLSRDNVSKKMSKLIILLFCANILFLGYVILGRLNVIKVDSLLVISLFSIFVSMILIFMIIFYSQIKFQRSNFISPKITGSISVIAIILGIFFYFINSLMSGIFSGIAFGFIIIYLVNRFNLMDPNKK